MQILMLSPSMPSPTWGFGTRVYQFLRILARRHAVTLVAYAEPGDEAKLDPLRSFCTVHAIPRNETSATKRLAQITSIASPTSFQRRNLHSEQMQRTLTQLAQTQRFDVIQIESSQLASYDFESRALLVLDEHNIEYELLYRMYLTESSALRRAYNWIEYKKFRREEIATWHQVSACITTSRREEEMIKQVAATPVLTVPNAVDVDYFGPSDTPADPNAIVLTGLMKYRPNLDAVIYFVNEILPRILAVRPKIVFYAVGGEPPDELTRLAGPNVVVTGTVPDVRPYVHKASVFVVPLRMGSGTRLKVLEGLSMRKPMVSTSLGCEGIDVEHGRHLLIADDPESFATGVLELLERPTLADSLASAGRDLVERKYMWESVVQQMEAFYLDLIERKRAQ